MRLRSYDECEGRAPKRTAGPTEPKRSRAESTQCVNIRSRWALLRYDVSARRVVSPRASTRSGVWAMGPISSLRRKSGWRRSAACRESRKAQPADRPESRQNGRMEYEYKVVAFSPEQNLQLVLNTHGREGWRLCTTSPTLVFLRTRPAYDKIANPKVEPAGPKPRLLRIGEAAQFLGVSRTTMYQLMHSVQLKTVRIGGSGLSYGRKATAESQRMECGRRSPSTHRPTRAYTNSSGPKPWPR